MKMVLVCLGSLLLLTEAPAQQLPQNRSNQEQIEFYLQKKKQQKTAAWTLLGLGVVASVYAIDRISNESFFSESSGREAIFVGGVVLSAASIPLFIAAAKNGGRAEVLLRSQPVSYTPFRTWTTSVQFNLPFGKQKRF